MALAFSTPSEERITATLARYPNKQAALLPVLWIAQEEWGYVSEEAMELVARKLDLSPAFVYGVVTFYTMYAQEPRGRFHLQVCGNLSCCLRGAERITHHLEKRLMIKVGETTDDKTFSLTEVECLASCGTAPMMQVDERVKGGFRSDYHENLTEAEVDRLLEELRARARG
ncbi:MAG TPA: NAD(P)H-dependent oxidoreductase subunit E [Myxococcota bacterium]|jgi:NADH-quinone oxidoreductase subunit E|nr:NAD(P)H-dependent oxidoreductase subunit E [Myxococcota bacterium]